MGMLFKHRFPSACSTPADRMCKSQAWMAPCVCQQRERRCRFFPCQSAGPPPIGNTISCAIERLSAEVCKLILAHCPPPSPVALRRRRTEKAQKISSLSLSFSPLVRSFRSSAAVIIPHCAAPCGAAPLSLLPHGAARQRGGAFASRSTAPNLTAAQLSQGGRARLQPCSLQQQMRG